MLYEYKVEYCFTCDGQQLVWSPEHYKAPKGEAWRLVGCNKPPEGRLETIGVELGLERRLELGYGPLLALGHGPLLALSVLVLVAFRSW